MLWEISLYRNLIFSVMSRSLSGARTNLKVGGGHRSGAKVRGHRTGAKRRKTFWSCPSTFLALKAQLVVLVSAFVMLSTVWSVYCLLFYHGAPRVQPFVKVRGMFPHAPSSRRHCRYCRVAGGDFLFR